MRCLGLGLAMPFGLALAPSPPAASVHAHAHQAPIHVHALAGKHADTHHAKDSKHAAPAGNAIALPAPIASPVSGVLAITDPVVTTTGPGHARGNKPPRAPAALVAAVLPGDQPTAAPPALPNARWHAVAHVQGAAPAGGGRATIMPERNQLWAVVEPPVAAGSLSIGQAGSPLPANIPVGWLALMAAVNVLVVLAVVRRRGTAARR